VFEIPTTVEIADGTYPAVVESIESGTGSFGPQRKWSFLVEHDGKIDSISAITSGNTGPRSKAYAFLSGLLGRAPLAGEKIDDPTGTRCLVTITHNEKGFPTIGAVAPYQEPQQTLPGVPR
jgi:hypothetical protein